MKSKERNSITKQIIYVFIVVTILMVLLAGFNFVSLHKNRVNVNEIRRFTLEQLEIVNNIQFNASRARIAIFKYLLSDDKQKKELYVQQLIDLEKQNNNLIYRLDKVVNNLKKIQQLERVISKRTTFIQNINLFFKNRDNPLFSAARFEENNLGPSFNAYINEISVLIKLIVTSGEDNIAAIFKELNYLRILGNVLIGAGIIILFILTYVVIRVIKKFRRDHLLLEQEIVKKEKAEQELTILNRELQTRVEQRTEELKVTNRKLLKLNRIIDFSANPIIIRNLDDKIIFWNKGAEEYYECSEEAALDQDCPIYFKRQFSNDYEKIKKELLETGYWEGEIIISSEKYNEKFIVKSQWTLYYEDNKPLYILEIDQDITNQKKIEEKERKYILELEELDISRKKIFSVISHDLRSPLNGLLSSCNVLLDNLDNLKKEEIKQFAEIINRTSQKMLEQLNNLVEWAKSQHRSHTFNPIKLQLCQEIISALQLLKSNALNKKIELKNNVKNDIVVKADLRMLHSIFQNLIGNSLKFTPEGGTITIDAVEKESMIEIRISDTGMGMSEEKIKKIFNSEDNISSTKGTNQESGTGLGLLLVKEFVTKHGGTINVESTEGIGTAFHFSLPKK